MSTYTVKKSTALISIALLVAIAGAVGFYAASFAKAGQASNGQNLQGRAGQMQRGTGTGAVARNTGGMVSGELIKKDDGSMSIQLRDGSSKLVLTTSSTKAFKMSEASLGDFAVGQNLMITGKQNTDGSVTAQSVQLRPEGMVDFPQGGNFQQRTTGTGPNSQPGNMQYGGGTPVPPPGM